MIIIDWIKKQYQKIQKSNDDIYLTEIDKLNDMLDGAEETNSYLIKKVSQLTEHTLDLQEEIDRLTQEDDESEKPNWLIGKMIYKPVRRFVSKTKDVTLRFEKPQYCFDKSTILYDLLKKHNLLKVEKTYNNMKKVMKLVTGMLTYENDKADNWRPISDVLMFKYGDCDDLGGIAITSALGMAGWADDEVFAWCGWYYPKGKSIEPTNKFCHAWCIARCNNNWYVLEGTNRTAVPRLWKDWKDKYEGNLGGCNWKFEGVISNNRTYIE